jgi:xylulokinase
MAEAKHLRILAYDVGTSGVKTCLFDIADEVRLSASALRGYGLSVFPDGGAEQDPEEWWDALRASTAEVLASGGVKPREIDGISFCSQMQGLVLVDKQGRALRPAMSYMDQRAREELRQGMQRGIKIGGLNAVKTLRALNITGAVAGSVKDPVWKYVWVKNHEPGIFRKAYKWLDAKEYLICRMTGRFVMTQDSAFATELLDIRRGRWCFNSSVCGMYGVDPAHLPEIISSSDIAGTLLPGAARELGLEPGTSVFGGGGDAALIGVGAGATALGATHVYSGTSGWVGTVTGRSVVDISSMMAAIVGAEPGLFVYFAELETAGKCLEWVRDHLALDEINIYLEKTVVTDSVERNYTSLYDYLSRVISEIPAGCGGVIFTPWLHGNRMPFEDSNARGMFFNISLETGKTELIRSVIEGVCFHLRWFIETQDRRVRTSNPIRFVGGGALSEVTCQILADCTGRSVETVANPQNAGAVGAALVAAKGLGLMTSIRDAGRFVKPERIYVPNRALREVYDRNYGVFVRLYGSNRRHFAALNDVFEGARRRNHG